MSEESTSRRHMSQGMRTALDFGPLLIYLASFFITGKNIYISTAAFMAATFIALALYYIVERRLAPLPMFTAIVVGIFGGLTIYLQDQRFIMMKPTIIYVVMAMIFMGSAFTGRNILGVAMSPYLKMTEEGWKTFLIRFGIFFFVLAIANEILRHYLSFETWLFTKAGFLVVTLLFSFSQAPFLSKHIIVDDDEDASES